MPSRSSAPAIELSPIQWSLLGHLAVVATAAVLLWIPMHRKASVEIEVIDSPKVSASAQLKTIAPTAPRVEVPKKRAVFGVSRKSITASEGEEVKAGNTVAKEVDSKSLRPGDDDSLPIPADEFLVTAMPQLESEVRIPYPPEAREKRVQGAVIMDLLIDGQGVVREAKLVTGPGAGLNEAALSAVRSFKFKPARIQEQSVAVRIRYAYRFVLEK